MKHSLTRLFLPPRLGIIALAVALLAAGFTLFISESAYRQSSAELRLVGEMGRTGIVVMDMLSSVTSAESAQRGYLLTGQPEYRGPYDAERQALGQDYARLQAELRARLPSGMGPSTLGLMQAVDGKISEMDEVLRLHDSGQLRSAHELVRSGIGRERMDVVRARSADLITAQTEGIRVGLGNLLDTLRMARIGIGLTTVTALLLLVLYLHASHRLEALREAQVARMQSERDRLEREVTTRTDDLAELARHLQTAREDERARLARELHDELGALLTAAKLDVARIRPKLQHSAPEQMERLAHLNDTLNSGIALKRRIIEDLRPSTLDNLGLKAALEILLAEFGERSGVRVVAELDDVTLAGTAQLTAYRLVQEALTNVAKHARATEVRVLLREEAGRAFVAVHDDGQGFDAAAVPRASHGLRGMRHRVDSEGGRLQVTSTPGAGTRVAATLPLGTHRPTGTGEPSPARPCGDRALGTT